MILNDVTLVCVAGTNIEQSMVATLHSKQNIKFYETLFFSPTIPNNIDSEIKYVKIDNINQTGFSNFMFFELHKYIQSSHILFVHHDGFIVNFNLWDNIYLKYDWVGAPWIRNLYCDNCVGNGGFSLRSKTILELPTKLGLDLITTNDMAYPVEDMNYCVYHYNTMISNNIKYAPIELAAKFSTEIYIEGVTRESFGFHNFVYGNNNKYRSLI